MTIRVPGPIGRWDGILLSDATFQDAPEWTSADAWVADDSPGLAYEVPPTAAVRIGVRVADGEYVTVVLRATPPQDATKVYDSFLAVGEHGWTLTVGAVTLGLPAESGVFPVSVWVDGKTPQTTRTVSIVLGERVPRSPGKLKDHPDDSSRFLTMQELEAADQLDRLTAQTATDELMLAVQDWAHLTRVLRLFIDAPAGADGPIVDRVAPSLIDDHSAATGRVVAAAQRCALLSVDEAWRLELRAALQALNEVIASLGDPIAAPDIGRLDGSPGAAERAFALVAKLSAG